MPYYLGQDVELEVRQRHHRGLREHHLQQHHRRQRRPLRHRRRCPLFPAGPKDTTVYHGGVAGDLKAGLAWGIFSDVKDDEPSPTGWSASTSPSPPRRSTTPGPAGCRATTSSRPYVLPSQMAGGRPEDLEVRPADRALQAHGAASTPTSRRTSRCRATSPPPTPTATTSTIPAPRGTASPAPASPGPTAACAPVEGRGRRQAAPGRPASPSASSSSRSRTRWRASGWSSTSAWSADYTSKSRWYNELTDATGKLLYTESYLQVGGLLSFLFRASRYVAVQGAGRLRPGDLAPADRRAAGGRRRDQHLAGPEPQLRLALGRSRPPLPHHQRRHLLAPGLGHRQLLARRRAPLQPLQRVVDLGALQARGPGHLAGQAAGRLPGRQPPPQLVLERLLERRRRRPPRRPPPRWSPRPAPRRRSARPARQSRPRASSSCSLVSSRATTAGRSPSASARSASVAPVRLPAS